MKPFIAAFLLAIAPQMGLAFEPDLPVGARQLVDEKRLRSSYELPVGAYRNGTLPTERARGLVRLQSWRIDGQAGAIIEIGEALVTQLLSEGYELVFHCDTEDCGGFDFRFETLVLPPPDMFVDLSNFRFLSLRRETDQQPEVAGLLLSHTASAAMVQLISVSPMHPVQLNLVDAKEREDAEKTLVAPAGLDDKTLTAAPATLATDVSASDIAQTLSGRGHVVLSGLSFQTGSSNLAEEPFASLAALADWLRDNPKRRVALVGHTDSKGALEANTKLSQARAASVQERLIVAHGVAAEQLEAHGIGYLAPIASNSDDTGRNANRRVEAVLLNAP